MAHGFQLVANGLENRDKGGIHEDDLVFGMVDDVHELVRGKPWVQGVEHAARARNREIQFEVKRAVPAECPDAIAGLHSQSLERVREAMNAPVKIAIGIAVHGTVIEAAGDLSVRIDFGRTLEDVRERQRIIHHQTGHAGRFLKDLFRDGHFLHIAGALVDTSDLRIAIEFFHRVIFREPDAAEHLDGTRRDALRYLRSEVFAHGGFGQEGAAGVMQPSSVVNHQARGFDIHGHFSQLKLDALKFRDGAAELFTLLSIGERVIERPLRETSICAPMPMRPSFSVSIATL